MSALHFVRLNILQRRFIASPLLFGFIHKYTHLPSPQLLVRFASSRSTSEQTFASLVHYPCTNSKCCRICNQPFLHGFPLSEVSNNGYTCNGCAYLLNPYKNEPEMQCMIISRLREKPLQYQISVGEPEFMKDRRPSSIVKTMKTRKRRLIQTNRGLEVWDSPPSPEEIIELARLSRGRCAISGILGHWSLSEHLIPPPFLLEFDHMVPISMGGSFGKQNLQVLIRCLNQVKGNHSDDELRRWLKAFRETNTLTIKTLAKKK